MDRDQIRDVYSFSEYSDAVGMSLVKRDALRVLATRDAEKDSIWLNMTDEQRDAYFASLWKLAVLQLLEGKKC